MIRESLNLDISCPEDVCGCCRREIDAGEFRLSMRLLEERSEDLFEVEVCRPCLAEHCPELLADIERGEAPSEWSVT